MKSQELLAKLKLELKDQAKILRQLEEMSLDQLSRKPAPERWNALEAIAHLNSYARYYLPAFDKAIKESEEKGWKPEEYYSSSWLGRISIKSVSPETRKRRIKTPKQHNHKNVLLTKDEILRLQNHLDGLEILLNRAENISLKKAKINIEIASWLKLPLGDFFPFLISHQSRHLAQAMEATHLEVQQASRAQG